MIRLETGNCYDNDSKKKEETIHRENEKKKLAKKQRLGKKNIYIEMVYRNM